LEQKKKVLTQVVQETFLTTVCLGVPALPTLRYLKMVDPVCLFTQERNAC